MKTKNKKISFTVPIVLAVALILVVSMTLALFTQNVDGVRRFTLSNFNSSVTVSFIHNGVETANGGYYVSGVSGPKYYVASVDPSASNYIGKMCVKVNYQGKGVGLLRVHITEELSTTSDNVTTVQSFTTNVPYTISSPYVVDGQSADSGNKLKWYDNRAVDHCFYYASPISTATNKQITLITGTGMDSSFDRGAIPSGTQIRVIIEADVVQVNRYPQYWKINSLPWTSASSATQIDPNIPLVDPMESSTFTTTQPA